jgi:hypothetical protein
MLTLVLADLASGSSASHLLPQGSRHWGRRCGLNGVDYGWAVVIQCGNAKHERMSKIIRKTVK